MLAAVATAKALTSNAFPAGKSHKRSQAGSSGVLQYLFAQWTFITLWQAFTIIVSVSHGPEICHFGTVGPTFPPASDTTTHDTCHTLPRSSAVAGNLNAVPDQAGLVFMGPVAQRITRLTTDQKIPGSNPGRLEILTCIFHQHCCCT